MGREDLVPQGTMHLMNFRIDTEFRSLIPPLSDEEFAQLEASILSEGVRDPLVVWSNNGAKPVLIEGHHRWQIIKRHGITKYRVVEKQFPDRDSVRCWIIDCQCGRRNLPSFTKCMLQIQKMEFSLRLQAKENQRLSEGRRKGLQNSANLKAVHVDEELARAAGVSRDTIQRVRYLMENANRETLDELKLGHASVNDAYVRTRRLVDLRRKRTPAASPAESGRLPDEIEIICGDCRKVFPTLLKSKEIDLVVADPPYNVGFRGYRDYDDQMPDGEYIEMLSTFCGEIPVAIIQYPEEMMRYVVPALGVPDDVLCWNYNSNLPRQFRLINVYGKQPDFDKVGQPFKNPDDRRIRSLLQSGIRGAKSYDWIHTDIVKNVAKGQLAHPCPLPLRLMEWLILLLTDEGDCVCDPFAGSGTTLLACRNLGRKAIGIERSKEYVRLARERLAEPMKDSKETPAAVSAHLGDNAVLFKEVAELYLKSGDKVADITFVKGTFWRDIDTGQFDFHASDLMTSAKRPFDFKKLPYGDAEFDAVVFDPPYAHNPGEMLGDDNYRNSATTKGFYHKDIIELYRRGMEESKRILKRRGLLFVKCQDEVESSSQRRSHIEIFDIATEELGLTDQDCFVLVTERPVVQYKRQEHARKNHSFLWVFRKQ